MRPLVSELLPTRNRPELVRRAVACYLAETYDNRELVILDDGEGLDPREFQGLEGVRYYWHQESHLARKRDRLVELARGDLCAWRDDDDWTASTKLDAQLGELGNRRLVAWCPRLLYVRSSRPQEVWVHDTGRSGHWYDGTALFHREDWRPGSQRHAGQIYDGLGHLMTPGAARLLWEPQWLTIYLATVHDNGAHENTTPKAITERYWRRWEGVTPEDVRQGRADPSQAPALVRHKNRPRRKPAWDVAGRAGSVWRGC